MMSHLKYITLIISLLSILSIQPHITSATEPGIELIREACKDSLYYDLCVSSLQSDPEGLKADIAGLAAISIKVAHDNAVQTYKYITEVLNKTADALVQQFLNDCSENYSDAVDQLGDSIGQVLDKMYGEVNVKVTAAMSDVDSCEQSAKEQPGKASLLSQHNFELSKLCNNALVLTKLISG
ncbi:pectinesterase inhibitor-like [Magnolia sinica]|uniref:pectinesterase inhibitor-like n=1 Tax=Magnolia sinica TaxID=86752 RepID=UPI00265A558E|nr:pectinesterase inhibitor-like [Magnolia sinica]